ncbi:MAG: hypothetical protein F4X24_00390 [Rhodobacteraceae bacterium]|nr:hypothetical protein [Paracoccaceae bacterium]
MKIKPLFISMTMILSLLGSKGYSDLYPSELFQDMISLLNSVEVEVDYIDLEESNDEIFARNLTLIVQVDSGEGILGVDFPTFRMSRKGTDLVEVYLPDTFSIFSSSGDEVPVKVGEGTFAENRRIIMEQNSDGMKLDYSISEMEVKHQDEDITYLVLLKDALGIYLFDDLARMYEDGFSATGSAGEISGRLQTRAGNGLAFKLTNYQSSTTDGGLFMNDAMGMEFPLGDYSVSMETAQFILEGMENSSLGLLINQPTSDMSVDENGLTMNSSTLDFIIALEGYINESVAVSNTDMNLLIDWNNENDLYNVETGISLNKIRWESTYKDLMDPEGEFNEDVGSLNTSIRFSGNKALFDQSYFEEQNNDDLSPEIFHFFVSSDWEIRIMDLFVKVVGEYTSSYVSNGEFDVIVEGAKSFFDRVIAADLAPQAYLQGILGYMMVLDPNSTSPNALQYKIEIDDEFEILVNGNNLN